MSIDAGTLFYGILLGSAFRAMVGRSSVVTMAVSSYVSDSTAPEDRSRRLSFLLSTRYFGYLFGLAMQAVILYENQYVPHILAIES